MRWYGKWLGVSLASAMGLVACGPQAQQTPPTPAGQTPPATPASAGASPRSSESPASIPPPIGAPTGGRITGLRMLSAQTRWAWTPTALWWTRDGGVRWQDVTPPQQPADATFVVDPVSATTAWVAVASARSISPPLPVYRTTNHGQTWTPFQVPGDTGASFAAFFSAQRGVLADDGAGAMGQEALVLQVTTDGGHQWSTLPSSETPAMLAGRGHPASPHPIPLAGDKNGMTWPTPREGFLTGNRYGHAVLLRTADGGAQWAAVALPAPPGPPVEASFPPIFFSAARGILPVQVGRDQIAFDTTADGGQSWRMGERLSWTWTPPDTIWAFATATTGWALAFHHAPRTGAVTGAVFDRTTHGGTTWHRLHPQGLPTARVRVLDPISATVGWAVAPGKGPWLWKTTDGGQSWKPVTPVHQPPSG